ncbi:MAG: 30S ribosomal protein S3 [Candidatus Komeilibacteria bacterium]|nr:30S ribosomal protein S3 [Candidatus Komeilibacteria bacterium]
MGHKVNPRVFRLGISQTSPSKWFARNNADLANFLRQDLRIRKYLQKKLKEAHLDRIEIERTGKAIIITITTARPGLIIGRGGSGIEELRKELLKNFLVGQSVKVNIQEVANPNLSSAVVLQGMIADIEKRIPFRRVMKQSIERVRKAGALGVKVRMSGRLNGVEIARTEILADGKVPLHTLRANIDYSRGAAFTTYGYKGEVFEEKNNNTVTK